MTEKEIPSDVHIEQRLSQGLKHLTHHQVLMIDEAINAVGEYGEVHLKVEKGRLRFLITQTSHDALKQDF